LLEAVSFKRWNGELQLVVVLPDGTPGTIPAEATSVLGPSVSAPRVPVVLSVEGVGRLRGLVSVMAPAVRPSRKGAKTRK
jgi:hypothetical protein